MRLLKHVLQQYTNALVDCDVSSHSTDINNEQNMPKQRNRSLLSYKNSHFQNEAKCTTFLVKVSFILHENEKSFPYQRLST